eukprot:CAMPEP_0180565182 /NCGR_PEP_ID=MMETSP1037_2-20121125/5408_1 /TAXON_ID=632150 /ORGANISM="Azadinium spinosum, Strain 3D9" /LENGTH=143 /DNA_ID=CAMNT_0022582133 /DNA_START=376 /DNA_END=808 /DNA_ORIENTATION=-
MLAPLRRSRRRAVSLRWAWQLSKLARSWVSSNSILSALASASLRRGAEASLPATSCLKLPHVTGAQSPGPACEGGGAADASLRASLPASSRLELPQVSGGSRPWPCDGGAAAEANEGLELPQMEELLKGCSRPMSCVDAAADA